VTTVSRPPALSCVDGLYVKVTHALKVTHASMQHSWKQIRYTTHSVITSQYNGVVVKQYRMLSIKASVLSFRSEWARSNGKHTVVAND